MAIPTDQQLDAFTGFRDLRDFFASHGVDLNEDGFTVAGRAEVLKNGPTVEIDIRSLFTFSREELIAYLRMHPERLEGYFDRWRLMQNIHEIYVVERINGGYVLYRRDREHRRDERFYADMFEAAADWLCTQYGMWLQKEA